MNQSYGQTQHNQYNVRGSSIVTLSIDNLPPHIHPVLHYFVQVLIQVLIVIHNSKSISRADSLQDMFSKTIDTQIIHIYSIQIMVKVVIPYFLYYLLSTLIYYKSLELL